MENRSLDPRIRIVWIVGSLIPAVIPVVAAIGAAYVDADAWITALLGAVAILAMVLALTLPSARYRAWSYRLTPLELITRHGVVVRRERWIPRTRIQYVDIVGGPLARALGLRTLVVFTAGSKLATVGLPGVALADAEGLRAELLSWAQDEPISPDAGYEPPPWPAPEPDEMVGRSRNDLGDDGGEDHGELGID